MYAIRHVHIPVSGRGPQLRAALEEHSKSSNAEGGRYSVLQEVFSPRGAFVNLAFYENLAAIDAYNASATPARGARIAAIGECVERRWQELEEVLVAAQPTGDFSYVLRVNYSALPGKGPEVRKLLEERVHTRYPFSGNVGASLHTQALGRPLDFTVVVRFPDLAGFEEFRNANRTEAAFQSSQARIIDLLAGPAHLELQRVLLRSA